MKILIISAATAALAVAGGAIAQTSSSTTGSTTSSQTGAWSGSSHQGHGATARTGASSPTSTVTTVKKDKTQPNTASGDVSSPAAGDLPKQSPGSPAGPSGDTDTGPRAGANPTGSNGSTAPQ
ncbi:hypothetical protein [Phenylobacterium deserti]|uniref:Proteophosphoglycan ppg4 n=1 Tax=Phenylobacterium deserti TaxID=1914756 RepID=A0A328AED6_9CAUL|nr:hypothetical protein [Phenylobacterium deserti]RAK52905.1 hypothetical protein DJ018_12070 [Phenylobacterium deserti]